MSPIPVKEKILKIPAELLIDILALIVRHRLKHQVSEVLQSRSLVILVVCSQDKDQKQEAALRQIEDILDEYHRYRHSENEDLNWKDA